MSFLPIPALDLRDNRVVRLRQGDYDLQTDYAKSAIELATGYASAGASWLHLVDLDAARNGGWSLQSLVRDLHELTALQIQSGGGVRSGADVDVMLAAGVDRVVVGTLAVRDPEVVRECLLRHGAQRITVALDARQDADGEWRLPVKGWTESSPRTLAELLQFYSDAGLEHILCTDIARDGMLSGYNIEWYRTLARRWPQLRFQASGGVRDVTDVRAAREAGAAAAILGRALLEGKFTLPEALAC